MKDKVKFNDNELLDFNLRYQAAYNMNQRFVNTLIRAVKLCAPLSDGLNVLYGYNDTGKNLNNNIYNSTPKWCSNSRANKLHSLLLPINRRWGSIYSTNDETGEDHYEEQHTLKVFNAIDKSNLHSIAKSFFLDLNIGCGAIWIDSPSKERPIVFKNIAGITLMPEFSDDPMNTNTWFKKVINWRDLNILNPEVAKGKDIAGEYNITCGYLDLRETKYKKYCYIQFLEGEFSEPLSVSFSSWRQLILVNETLRPGEARGHGIILQILEDIEYLNEITGSIKGYINYSANPDLLVPDGLPYNFGTEGGNIYPTELIADGRMPVQPIQWQINIQAVQGMIQDLEQKIRQFFNVMPLGMPENTPHATATEVGYRQADEERQSVADLARVANETLGGLMSSIFAILVERGIIESPESKLYDFKFDSPAVDIQAQDNVNSILQLATLSTQILGEGSGNIYLNQQETFNALDKNLKVTYSVLNSPQEVKNITDAAHKAATQQQEDKSGGSQQQQQQDSSLQPSSLGQGTPIDPAQLGQNTSIVGMGV